HGKDIHTIGRDESVSSVPTYLQLSQAGKRPRLMQHMREKLRKGEQLPHQPFERQHFDDLLLMKHVHAAELGIQLQDDVMADELGGDVVAFEIEADHAVPIYFALQMESIQW